MRLIDAVETKMANHEHRASEPETLEQLIDVLDKAGSDATETSLGTIVEIVGTRSFGPLLLFAGLIAMSPLSGIPGAPSLIGVLVALISVQLLAGRSHFWLPQWIRRRCVVRSKYEKVLNAARAPARFVDGFLRPRLVALTSGPGLIVAAALSLLMAIALPLLELVPFAATIVGVMLAAFGLSLIAHDGLLWVVALLVTACVAIFGPILL